MVTLSACFSVTRPLVGWLGVSSGRSFGFSVVVELLVGFEEVEELLLEVDAGGSEELALLLSEGSPIGSDVLLSELSDGSELSDVEVETVDWNSWSSGRSLKESGAPQATSASRSSMLIADRNTLFIRNAFLDDLIVENGLFKR